MSLYPILRQLRFSRTPIVCALSAAIVFGLEARPAAGAEWIGPDQGSWSDGNNWSDGAVPVGAAPFDPVFLNNGSTINQQGMSEANFVYIGSETDGGGTLNIAGTLALSPFSNLYGAIGQGSYANIYVSGLDANLSLTAMYLNGSGTAQLGVHDGGHVSATRIYLDNGNIAVSGLGTELRARLNMSLGGDATGSTLTVSDQAVLVTGTDNQADSYSTLAGPQGSIVRATVTGANSLWRAEDKVVVGNNGDVTLLLTQGGRMSAPSLAVAQWAGNASIVVGSEVGEAPAPAGVLDVSQITFGQGNGALVFHFSGDPVSYGGNLSGQGALKVLAGELTYMGTAANGVSTTVSGATLKVNGVLNGPVSVGEGGTLGGSGSMGTTTLARGATLAPGNSIGTLRVRGDLRFEPGSTYRVEADPEGSASDQVVVDGTAYLAGSVLHVGPDGGFDPQRTYTILKATALDGAFDRVGSDYAFLAPALSYSDTDVTLALVRKPAPPVGPEQPPTGGAIRFSDAARTGNQRSVAEAIDGMSPGNAVHDYVLTLRDGLAPAVFDSLSGEVYASNQSMLMQGSAQARGVALSKLRANLQAPVRPGAPTAAASSSDLPASAAAFPVSGALPAWAQVVGNWQTLDADGNAGRVRQRIGGLFVGGDHAVGAGWRLGAALGYTDGNIRVDDRASRSDVSSYSALLYGGRSFDTPWGSASLLLGGGYTWHDVSTRRQVTAQATSLTADYGASTSQLFAELSHAWKLRESTTLEPFVGVGWADLRTRSFSESGGAAALSGESGKFRQTTTTLGLRAAQAIEWGRRSGSVYGTLGWRHLFGDDKGESRMAFQGSQFFTVSGAPIGRDAALLEVGADMAVARNATVGLSYAGQFAGGSRDHSGMVDLRWRF